jgi:predicted ATP-dependent endonuclease of OLD family
MLLTRLHDENFRGIKLLDLVLRETSVLIGESNSGKTTFLHYLERKKKAYFARKQGISSSVSTTQVINTQSWSWTPAFVEQRQNNLINVLSTSWDLK